MDNVLPSSTSPLNKPLSGIGIRSAHIQEVLSTTPKIGLLEAHSENYFGCSPARDKLIQLSQHYPISLHSVGVSLGRCDQLDKQHLHELKSLVDDIKPAHCSEHLAWSAFGHRHVPDLLPLALNEQSLSVVCDHIKQMQDILQHQIYIENPSNYAVFNSSYIKETDFLNSLAYTTGCGLLMDINNIYISAFNIGQCAEGYINQIEAGYVKQFHLAGHLTTTIDGTDILIDSHDQVVDDKVWALYQYALKTKGVRPTIIEWDSDLPELQVLIEHAEQALQLLQSVDTNDRDRPHRTAMPIKVLSTKALSTKAQPTEAVSIKTQAIEKANVQKTVANEEGIQDIFLNSIFSMQSVHGDFITSHQPRIKVYQTNCFSALKQYLNSVYPATINALGENFYNQFIHQYISQHQPDQGNLHQYGYSLEAFAEQYPSLNDYPYVVHLIALEWAIHCAYYADNRNITNFDDVSILTKKITLNDSVTLLNTGYCIQQLWQQSLPNFKGTFDVSMIDGYNEMLIVFKTDTVKVDSLKPVEYQLLLLMKQPISLQDCIEQLSEIFASDDITQALASIIQRQVITHYVT